MKSTMANLLADQRAKKRLTPQNAPNQGGTTATSSPRVHLGPGPNGPVPNGDGRLKVVVSTDSGPIQALRFGAAPNATIDIGSRSAVAPPFTYTADPGVSQLTFFVRRVNAGEPVHVPLVVVDAVGDWPTFVGGAPGAF
jgi:hypothetical protein